MRFNFPMIFISVVILRRLYFCKTYQLMRVLVLRSINGQIISIKLTGLHRTTSNNIDNKSTG